VTTVTAKTLRISRSKISKGGAVVEATAPLFSSYAGFRLKLRWNSHERHTAVES